MADNQSGKGRARGRARGRPQVPAPAVAGPSRVPSVTSSSEEPSVPIGRALARTKFSDTGSSSPSSMGGSGNGDGHGDGNGNGNGNGAKPIGRGSVRSGRPVDVTVLNTRPNSVSASKKGQSGQQVKFTSNYFVLNTDAKWSLCKHHVDFNPQEERTFIKRSLLKVHKDKFDGFLFDGSTLFTIRNACPQGKPLELVSERNDGQKMKITVKFVGTCEPGDYQYLQVFNIILRECLSHLKLQLIRRNYFDPKAKVEIPEFMLELWPGYVTSIVQCERNILLQTEISYKVLRKDSAYDVFRQCLKDSSDVRTAFSQAIMGSIILTSYNNKTYRIDEVDYSSTPTSTFPVRKKGETTNVSYVEYYEKKYGVKIRDLKQPMLISKSSARDRRAGASELVYLVPELCTMTGLTDQMRSNFQLMRAVAAHTSVGPGDRVKRLLAFNNRLNTVSEIRQKLSSWGMQLSQQLVEIPGRILPMETIVVGEGKQYDTGPDADWTRNLRSSKMLLNVDLNQWAIIYLGRSEKEVRYFVETLQKCARGMYFNIGRPATYALQDDRTASYVQSLDRSINERNPQLTLCVVPNNRADRYCAIKKKCIIDKPTPSQVVLFKTIINKGLMSIATKIAIQMNCKIGGSAWSVPIPIQGLMAIGFDVCHDPSDKRRSYSGMVATLDKSCTRYFSVVSRHSAGEELSNNFAINVMKAVKRFHEYNQALPKTIVVYRDGVGEGNIRYVFEQEVQNMKRELTALYEKQNQPVRLAFVIVTKGINTRIFYGPKNPPPGTVIDDVITNPFRYDFYLVSQSVRQGTVSPTHYNVIEDTTGLQPDHIQRLTYKFTHLYFNWSGTVRVPAPCQYAHKLAFLTSQSIGTTHSNLDSLLYFL